MLIHHLSRGSLEQRTPGHHLPDHHAQRIQVRADVYADSCKLLGTGKLWGPGKAPGDRNRALRTWFSDPFGQPEVDDFRGYNPSVLRTHHDVAWFVLSVNELPLVTCRQ